MQFKEIVEKIKNIKPLKENCKIHKSVLRIIENQTELMKLIENIYVEKTFVQIPVENFVDKLTDIIKKGKKIEPSNDSIKFFLEHYLMQYSHINEENDKNVLTVKTVSYKIMNNYNDFLFIVKLLDNDFLLTSVVKVLVGTLNSELLKKKIFINSF